MSGIPEQDDAAFREIVIDDWYRNGADFAWIRPRFNLGGKVADTRPRFLLNRYPYNVIGAGFVLFGRLWAVQWKGSKR